jgi:hypothetical protein
VPSTQSRVGIPLMFSVRALAHVYRNSRARHTLSGMNTSSKPPPIIMHSAMVTTPTHLLNNAVDRMRRTTPPPVSNKNCHTPPRLKTNVSLTEGGAVGNPVNYMGQLRVAPSPGVPYAGDQARARGNGHEAPHGEGPGRTWDLAAPILMASVTINDVLYGASHLGIDRDNLPAWRPAAAHSVTQTAARLVTVQPLRVGIEVAEGWRACQWPPNILPLSAQVGTVAVPPGLSEDVARTP